MSACSPGWGWLDLRRQRAVARTWIEALRIRAADPQQPVRALSGGNQQKVAIGRLLYQRSEEHTSELQSRLHLVCRLLLEKKKRQRCEHLRDQQSPRRDSTRRLITTAVFCLQIRRTMSPHMYAAAASEGDYSTVFHARVHR